MKLRTIRPAPASSSSDSATSATTSSDRTRVRSRPPDDPRVPSLRTSLRSARDPWSAGSRPRRRPAPHVTPITNSRTRQSSRGITKLGSPAGASAAIASTDHIARSRPAAAPSALNSSPSAMNCRARRLRFAPSAARIAVSRCRVDARARSRFARLTHAMSSTNPTAASIVSSNGSSCPTVSSLRLNTAAPYFALVSGYDCSS